MTSITIKYNYNTDETTLKKGMGFDDLERTQQLDMMQDGIELLTDLYNKKLDEMMEEPFNNKAVNAKE